MDIALNLFLLIGGLVVALIASDRAVSYTRAFAAALGAPTFIVGAVLVSIGTDLPEIANSIAAQVQGEGDVNVGDSVGSALTQYTLVMGLFVFVMPVIVVSRLQVGLVSVLTMAGLGLVAIFVADGWLGRLDGVVLVSAWAVFSLVLIKLLPGHAEADPPTVRVTHRLLQPTLILLALGIVGFGATVAVRALVRLAELVGVPEFLIAFFGASLGTSAPEIVVDLTALARGAPAIALGDAMGSSLVDATLSVGIGPIVAPAEVTPTLAVTASLYALVAVAIAGLLLAVRRKHDRISSIVLLALYAFAYVVLISAA